jgi:hypothetical protein
MIQAVSMGLVCVALEAIDIANNAIRPWPAVDFRTGMDSYTERASIERADTPDAWNSAWQRYMGVTPIGNSGLRYPSAAVPPAVDFNRNFVLVVFGGLAQVSGYRIADSFIKKKELHVRLEQVPIPGHTTMLANPYAFILFRRTKYPVDVEFPTTDASGNATWRRVAKLGGS